jgi:uncharacterized protein (DUF697 family)
MSTTQTKQDEMAMAEKVAERVAAKVAEHLKAQASAAPAATVAETKPAENQVKQKMALLAQEAEHRRQLEEARKVVAQHQKAEKADDPELGAANSTIKWHAAGAAAAALIPVTTWDMAAVAAVQLKLLSSLAKIYKVPFSEHAGKSVIGGLVGGFGAGMAATATVVSALKLIPVVGTFAGTLALPTVAYASTHAVGKVFTAHFASGGHLLNFDPLQAKKAFAAAFDEGKVLAPAAPAATAATAPA